MSCLFCKIIDGSIPAKHIHEDEHCVAIADIHPQSPVHLLVLPRKHLSSLANATAGDQALLGHLLLTVKALAEQFHLVNGYRTVINTGDEGGQTVDHLHLHLLGGRHHGWPPG